MKCVKQMFPDWKREEALNAAIDSHVRPLAAQAWRDGDDYIKLPLKLIAEYADLLHVAEKTHGVPVRRYIAYHLSTMLRIVGDEVQTNWGSRVPVLAAKRAWPHLLAHQVPPHRVGKLIAHSFTDGVLHIGCTRIPVAEINLLAKQLGLEGQIGDSPAV